MTTIPDLIEKTAMFDTDLLVVRAVSETEDNKITYANLKFELQKSANVVYAIDYGAKFDGIYLTTVTTTNGSPVVSCAARPFVATDVGKVYVLKQSVSSTTYMTRGTIVSVASGNATLSVNSTSTNTATAHMYFGTDDTAAIQAAVNAANPIDDHLGSVPWKYEAKGVVVFPEGMSMITTEIKLRTNVSFQGQGRYATWLKWASTNTMAVTNYFAMFHGGDANGSTQIYYDNQFRDMRIDMSAAFTTTYTYHAKCVEIVFAVRPAAINVFFDSSPATSFGLDYVAAGLVTNCHFYRSGRLWTTGGGGGSGVDFQHQPNGLFTVEHTLVGEPLASVICHNYFLDCMVSAVRSTNDNTTASTARTIISHNIVISRLTTGKGIEDNCNIGAVIVGNSITNLSANQTSEGPIGTEGQHIWAGIMVVGGENGVVVANTVMGPWHDGIRMNRFIRTGSSLVPKNYVVSNNTVTGAYRCGIRAEVDATYTMSHLKIAGNMISGTGDAGISMTNAGTGGTFSYISIHNNHVYDVGKITGTDLKKAAIYIDTNISGLHMADNYGYDIGNSGTKYGISINNAALTNSYITDNNFLQTTTERVLLSGTGSIAGEVVNNPGYRLGAATITPGASPYTYTAGNAPEVVYVTGGTVSGITKNGVAMPISGNFHLAPNESIIVSYSVVPTMVKDRK